MWKLFFLGTLLLFGTNKNFGQNSNQNIFPDGSEMSAWFSDITKIEMNKLGEQFLITDYHVEIDSNLLQTNAIQKVIDLAFSKGGGVIVIPKGVFLSGALFFKSNTHLYLADGATLKGSDNIADYPLLPSRMEGQCLDYYSALVNVQGVDGFSISGNGTIDGNGLKFWKAFWERRKENPQCTNLEVSRPRLLFIRNCNDVQIQGVSLHNSGFWTSHFYKCNNVKLIDLHIFSPKEPIKAPSTDAVDIDVCSNVLITGCYMSVNDDAIALKGGKGPWADTDSCNGKNANILIDNCEFGFCHAALTCGSEAIHNRNILMRNTTINNAKRGLWLKMRPDTPQKYEFIRLENIKGQAESFIYIKPWKQFFDLKGRKDVPISYSENISFKNIDFNCRVFFDVGITKYDHLSNFTFEDLTIKAENGKFNRKLISGITLKNVIVNNNSID